MVIKKNKTNPEDEYVPEHGEEALAVLIKEAGEEARKRKKKVMANHLKKLHAAACDTLPAAE